MIQLNLSSEDKLIIYCSRIDINEDIKFKIKKILSTVLDWNYIIDCSTKQGVTPLLYWKLLKICKSGNVPSKVMEFLENTYYSNLARNMILYDELSRILAAFKKIDIDTIVMKGAFLAEKVYKNIGLRSMSDIDLLIRGKDLQKVIDEFINLTYFAKTIDPAIFHELTTGLRNHNELQFIHKSKKNMIEIHWDISNSKDLYNIEISNFWENAKPIKIANSETLTFASENLLQHLCIHIENHLNSSNPRSGKPFRGYCDIATVTRHYKDTINWDYLLQSSRSYGIEKAVFQSLFIAKECFGALVPKDVISELDTVRSNIVFENIFRG